MNSKGEAFSQKEYEKKAENMMTSEEKALSKEREEDFFNGEEIRKGEESRARKWGKDKVLKETKPSEEKIFPDLIETKEYLIKKKKDYRELKDVFGKYILDSDFFLGPSKSKPSKIVNYIAQKMINGQMLYCP